jgi:hypothetical protein
MQRTVLIGGLTAVILAVAPAAGHAQYQAPPPDPGFRYIFDGTPTGSDASFDKWLFAAGTYTQSAPASQGGQGQATLDPNEGSFLVGASPFGAYWYPVKPFGDAVFRIQYTVQDTPNSTRNGGIMIRSPEIRYSCPNAQGLPSNCSTASGNAATLSRKPLGFNYDVCPGVINVAIGNPLCTLTEPTPAGQDPATPAPSTTYKWEGADGPFPPPFEYEGGYCARQTAAGVYNVNGLNNQPLTVNGNANNHQHWTQVYCGHEIQINESLTGGGPQPSTDPIKTGSVYGFRNLNAKQSGTAERLTKGVWHEMEIRTIGQQYTILIDGKLVNQFDNSIPKIASRAGDPPTMARQLAAGYLGLQTHGGNDRISYREIQVKEFTPAEIPVNTVAPTVSGPGYEGVPLTCNTGQWNAPPGTTFFYRWYRSNPIPADSPRLRAPSQLDYWNETTPAEPEHGTQNLTWLDSQIVGESQQYTPTADDIGKELHCAVNADANGATVWKTASAPDIIPATNAESSASGEVPATLSLAIGAPAQFSPFIPGVAANYDASTSANVISSAGNATLTVSDPSDTATGHLVNGTFSLPSKLQARASSPAGSGGDFADVGGSANPTTLLTYAGPTANDPVTLSFRQAIGATDPLRTGTYRKTLTFTLSTTEP